MAWKDIERRPPTAAEEVAAAKEAQRINQLFADVFGTPKGLEVLAILRERYGEASLGPEASHSALAYREGQRQLLREIETRTANGREQHPTELRREYPALG